MRQFLDIVVDLAVTHDAHIYHFDIPNWAEHCRTAHNNYLKLITANDVAPDKKKGWTLID